MNKHAALICLALSCLLWTSCDRTKKLQQDQATAEAAVDAAGEAIDVASEMAPTEPAQVQSTDSLFLSYERTPCFGRCPIFKIRLYQSGYVTYEGINFVDYMGYYHSKADQNTMDKLLAQIEETDFFAFEERYDDERLMDLPSRIFVVNTGGQKKKVLARYQAPETLLGFGLFIEDLFKDTEWTPVTHDH